MDTHETKFHAHRIEHAPASGTGTAVCECGATVRVERGVPVEVWHTCELCTHEYGRRLEAGR